MARERERESGIEEEMKDLCRYNLDHPSVLWLQLSPWYLENLLAL